MDILTMFKDSEKTKTFSKGEYIFHQGEPGEIMYVILEGEVDILLNDVVVATFIAGHIFGEMALIDDRARSASAFAKSDCKLVPVDKESFIFLVQQTPNFALYVMKILVNKVRGLDEILYNLSKSSK
jgi:CRP/FNR family transcriptional regulator, cyclic AMP receptor protein